MSSDANEPAPPSVRPSGQALDRSLVGSVAWTAASKWSGQIITFGITIFVARILSPEDYGLVGMGWLFLGLVRLLSEFAIGASVVIMHEVDRTKLARLNAFAVLLGLAGCAITAASAHPLGLFFSAPELPSLVLLMSSTFIITAFRSVPMAVLRRDLRFRTLAGIDLVQSILGAVCTLVLALLGARYWALVLGNTIALLVATAIAVYMRPQGFAWPHMHQLDRAFSISRNVVISHLGWYTYSNADFLIVGRMLGQTSLGLYTLGWTLAMAIVERVTAVVGSVMPAYLATTKHDLVQLRRYFYVISEGIAVVTFPVSIGLALVADDFCAVVLGPRWDGAVTPLQLLSVYAAIRSLAPLVAQVLTVLGHDAYVARNSLLAAIGMPIAFYAGAQWGLLGVAFAWVVAYPFVAVPLFVRAFRTMQSSAADYFRALTPAIIATSAMVAAVVAMRAITLGVDPAFRLAATVSSGVVVYTAVLFVLFRQRMRSLIARLRARPEPAAASGAPA